jgi:integrase
MENPTILDDKASVNALSLRYMERARARIKESTVTHSLNPAVKRLTDFMGLLSLAEVTPERADAYETHLFNHYKRNTVRHSLAVASGVFLYAVKIGAIRDNPFRLIKLPKREKVGRNLTDDLARKFLDLLPLKFRRAVKLSLYTGMRRAEVCYLDFDREVFDTYIRIPPERSKSGKERIIPIGPQVWKIIGPRKPGRVFDFSASRLTQVCVKAWHKLGQGRIRFHDMRHTAKTRFMELSADSAAANYIFGWVDDQSASPYEHMTEKRTAPMLRISYRI